MKRTIQQKIFYYSQDGLYKRKLEELENAEEKVAYILHHNVKSRNSDTELILLYWQSEGLYVNDFEMYYSNITPAETITRCRRHIQNDLNLYLPTDEEVIRARSISAEAVKEWALNKVKE